MNGSEGFNGSQGFNGSGGFNGGASVSVTVLPDLLKLATVPYQVTTASTFEVQVLAETLDPNAGSVTPPTVTDASSTVHTMAQKTLKWPGTVEDSVTVWYATVPLLSNQTNTLVVTSGETTINCPVKHKDALSVLSAANQTEFRARIATAMGTASVDVIEVNYDVTDLAAATLYAGAVTNNRDSWVTIRSGSGYSMHCNRDTGATALFRPSTNWANWDGVIFGSDTSDLTSGQAYIENNFKVWFSNFEVRGKYKNTWPRATPVTATPTSTFRVTLTSGIEAYATDGLFDGVAEVAGSFNMFTLARDCIFNSHRGDFNNFGKTILNLRGIDIDSVRNAADTDYLHNDGFQIWQNVATSDIVFKGLKVESPVIPAYLQPFLFDANPQPSNYVNVMLDSLIVEGAAVGTVLAAHMAGTMTGVRISNISCPEQSLILRRDLTGLYDPLVPTNVFVDRFNSLNVSYLASSGYSNILYNNTNVADVTDISPELMANPDLAGITFTNMAVKAA